MNQSGFHVYRGTNPVQKRRYQPNYVQSNRASGLSASFGQPTTTTYANYGVTRFENMLVDDVSDSNIDSQQPVPAPTPAPPDQKNVSNKKFIDKYQTKQPSPAQKQQQQEIEVSQQAEKQKQDKKRMIMMYSAIAIACVFFIVIVIAAVVWLKSSNTNAQVDIDDVFDNEISTHDLGNQYSSLYYDSYDQ